MFHKIDFDPSKVELAGYKLLTALPQYWVVDTDTFEFHETESGPQIVALLRSTANAAVTKLGLWYKNGEPAIDMQNQPALELWFDRPVEDVRTGYVNLYASEDNEHGFTVGSGTYSDRDDAEARGKRNQSGNYIATVAVSININQRG